MTTAICMCGQIRTLAYKPHQLMMLNNVITPLNASLFMVVSKNWTNLNSTTGSQIEGLKKQLAPVFFKLSETSTLLEKFQICRKAILQEESKSQNPFAWVVKTRPDVYFHCKLHPLVIPSGWYASAWDYFVVMPRMYANLALNTSSTDYGGRCEYHETICSPCKVKKKFNANISVFFKFVDVSRSCQLRKQELRKHHCSGVSTHYVNTNTSTMCPHLDMGTENWRRYALWNTLGTCIHEKA